MDLANGFTSVRSRGLSRICSELLLTLITPHGSLLIKMMNLGRQLLVFSGPNGRPLVLQ